MGNWRLEVARMALYMTFPVALFHYFNQPEYFEKWVVSVKRELYPPESKMHREEMQEFIRIVQERHDREMLQALEDSEKRQLKMKH